MGALFHGLAGMTMSLAWFFFFDGYQIAKDDDYDPFKFIHWLPGILCLLGFVIVSFVKPEHVISGSSDDDGMFLTGGADDESAVTRSKFLFMAGYFFMFGGLSVGIWKLADPYAKEGSPTAWPGVALLLQCVCIAVSATLCMVGRKKVEEGLMYY